MEPAYNFVKNVVQDFRQKLAGIYPDQEIRQIVYILFEEFLGWPKTRVQLSLDVEIPETEMNSFNMALGELCTGKPIQYVIRKAWFNGTLLNVDPGVLVPRPETEELCSVIKADSPGKQNQHFSVLDIGTGSGCIAIDLKKHFPHAVVTAIDISNDALEIAKKNAWANNCGISFIQNDILNQAEWEILGKYNMIVSNPPYVLESEKKRLHRNVIEFEPAQALFVTDNDPLKFYKAISGFAVMHLEPPARLYFEINEQFGKEVGDIVLCLGFKDVRILSDFHGKKRFVSAIFS